VRLITIIGDVRRFPGSRRYPQYNQSTLADTLATAGMDYVALADLGGRREPRPDSPHTAWRNPSFRAYADYMDTEAFRQGVDRIITLAGIVGASGYVLGVEIDPELAARARENLSHLLQVEISHADGSTLSPVEFDAIFVNAGVTELKHGWLEALAPRGRMLVPLTTHFDNAQNAEVGLGKILKLVRRPNGFSAQLISDVGIYNCTGARAIETHEALRISLARDDADAVQSLRLDAHKVDSNCWLHTHSFCLSTLKLVPC